MLAWMPSASNARKKKWRLREFNDTSASTDAHAIPLAKITVVDSSMARVKFPPRAFHNPPGAERHMYLGLIRLPKHKIPWATRL